ncbi:MAG: HD domain-containing protein [Candidatus Gracilibacteria bacterium]|nr:HD domain-containing protein [Candidatus Gracilibacteria bacterium]MDD3120472.1 HD domain-containing protein [Candidatus Gracilibacteria bacterium]MDD4530397.1 HD domain-containing protein [Candidatus Gracilibacteria bacterium]
MLKKIVNLIFEGLQLKRIKHEGWRLAGIPFPDSVAEHSLNAAQIGYILAKMEGADANKVATMLVWHDIGEARIGDMHFINTKYINNKNNFELEAMKHQFEKIDFGKDVLDLFIEYEERSTFEGNIAKDADYLEQAFQAKVYVETGYKEAQIWIDNVGKSLKTESAKKLWKELQTSSFSDWCRGMITME